MVDIFRRLKNESELKRAVKQFLERFSYTFSNDTKV